MVFASHDHKFHSLDAFFSDNYFHTCK